MYNSKHWTSLISPCRVGPTDFGMGGALYPPIGGGHMGGDKGPMGGDSRVNRDKIGSPLKYWGGTRVGWGGLARNSRQNLEVSQTSKKCK